jgi:hypothetical protein
MKHLFVIRHVPLFFIVRVLLYEVRFEFILVLIGEKCNQFTETYRGALSLSSLVTAETA